MNRTTIAGIGHMSGWNELMVNSKECFIAGKLFWEVIHRHCNQFRRISVSQCIISDNVGFVILSWDLGTRKLGSRSCDDWITA